MTVKNKEKSIIKIDTTGMEYRELNARLRDIAAGGYQKVELTNVCGQRYIGTDINKAIDIDVYGTPGNDLGAFMDGPRINVFGNGQDGCGNTMNSGEIIIHGHAGDIAGLSSRGGKIFIRDNVGYRAGIHMKEYGEKKPSLVIGGTAQDFFGEYMAGGTLVLLGLTLGEGEKHRAKYIGTGMHGGAIYIRGSFEDYQLGQEVGTTELGEEDFQVLKQLVGEYSEHFGFDAAKLLQGHYTKLFPRWLRPYGRLYAY